MPGLFQYRVIRVQSVLRNPLSIQYCSGTAILTLWNTEWHQYCFNMGTPHENFGTVPLYVSNYGSNMWNRMPGIGTHHDPMFVYSQSKPRDQYDVMVPWRIQVCVLATISVAVLDRSSMCSSKRKILVRRKGSMTDSGTSFWEQSVLQFGAGAVRVLSKPRNRFDVMVPWQIRARRFGNN